MNEAVTSLAPDAPENATKAMPLPQADARAVTPATNPPDATIDYSKAPSSLHAAQCKTFGEKMHTGIFDWGINFGVNLFVSAAFTQYVKHSPKPIWKNAPFGKNFFSKSPENAYNFVRDGIEGKLKVSRDIASRMTDALTLTSGGHLIMIPSVWLGSKAKAGFIEAVDNWYYGADTAHSDSWLQERHQAVRDEAKPTFVGTIVGRGGTVAAVQLTSAFLGAHKNAISYLGQKSGIRALEGFKGLDHVAGKFGHAFGEGFQDAMPGFSKKMDAFAQGKGLAFSSEQRAANAKLAGKPYKGAIADYSKYTALDTLYTGVTMFTIHPIINLAKSYIPGMTYHDYPPEKPDKQASNIKSQGKISYPEVSQGAAV